MTSTAGSGSLPLQHSTNTARVFVRRFRASSLTTKRGMCLLWVQGREPWVHACLCHGRKWSRGDIPSSYVTPPQRQCPRLPRVWDHLQTRRSHTHTQSTPLRCTPPGMVGAAISLGGYAPSGVTPRNAVLMRTPLIASTYPNKVNYAALERLRRDTAI